MTAGNTELLGRLVAHLRFIYKDIQLQKPVTHYAEHILREMRLEDGSPAPPRQKNNWCENDIVLITYGDSLRSTTHPPLRQLHHFLKNRCGNTFNSVHILPFFPYSSDDGFSIIDYTRVRDDLGGWSDIEAIADDFRLMADMVLNHCSSESSWFTHFLDDEGEGVGFFFEALENDDLSMVVRPRTSPLLRETPTNTGLKQIWCTFSHDQVDLDYRNPKVLLAMIRIIRLYLDRGVRLFRLDAVAFVWKEPGTHCINLPQTHEIVRLIRLVIEHAQPDSVVITETNIPVAENLSYFGDADEANWIYNFPLPPLLVKTLLTGNCIELQRFLRAMPPAHNGTAFFNFIASHDGIGLRPVEGLLDEEIIHQMVKAMVSFGGKVSWRQVSKNEKKPYEINISLVDALSGTVSGPDQYGIDRFLCAHAIMLGLEGIPGIYIHSLLGTPNDHAGYAETGQNRSINRHRWDMDTLQKQLDDQDSSNSRIFESLKRLIQIRKDQPAFHPNATQYTLQLGSQILGFWRQSIDRQQSIFAVHNIDNRVVKFPLSQLNIIDYQDWHDLIGGDHIHTRLENLVLQPYQTMWITNRTTTQQPSSRV